MTKDPKVIDPPDFDVKEAWQECADWVDGHEPGSIGGAMGADPGVCSCPACDQYYWSFGRVIECECGFQFPTNWWSMYSSGCNDGMRVKEGLKTSGGMMRKTSHIYYRHGFENPVEEAWKQKDQVDWRTVAKDWNPIGHHTHVDDTRFCKRCGKEKEESRKTRSGRGVSLCIKCQTETECVHGVSFMEKKCKAGVVLEDLTGIPCYYTEHAHSCECPKFEAITVEKIEEDDAAMDAAIARMKLTFPLISEIKKEHKGKNWSGTKECPVCRGVLHLSHASYNGHVHGACETENCLNWME